VGEGKRVAGAMRVGSNVPPSRLSPSRRRAGPPRIAAFLSVKCNFIAVEKSSKAMYLLPASLLLIVTFIRHNWGVEITRREAEIS